jgi:hypothetical protein
VQPLSAIAAAAKVATPAKAFLGLIRDSLSGSSLNGGSARPYQRRHPLKIR